MALKGRVIEYIDNGRFICGIVIEESGKRVRILNQNGREVNLPLARAMHKSLESHSVDKPREDLSNLLKSTAEKRQQMMRMINLEEIWELAIEENDSLFEPEFLTELCFGEHATDDHVASFMRSIFNDRLFFKYKEGKIIAHSEEVVKQLRIRREKELEKEALLNNGARALTQLWEGNMPEEWPERETCL
ncbi:MAG: ribonuclease R, partial [Desulfobulbaceae bacterium]|nr:ribonuclease R [Desulfobulbaceae bacterium]